MVEQNAGAGKQTLLFLKSFNLQGPVLTGNTELSGQFSFKADLVGKSSFSRIDRYRYK